MHSSKQVVVQRNGWGGKSARCTSGKALIPWQHHNNWEHNEILTFIACKYVKHIAWEELNNPRSQMMPIGCYAILGQIAKELQKKIRIKITRRETMCKDKWNALNVLKL